MIAELITILLISFKFQKLDGITVQQAIAASVFKSSFEFAVLSTLKLPLKAGIVSLRNITDCGVRRNLLLAGRIQIIYDISNQNISVSTVLAMLTSGAVDGSFALTLHNRLSSQGYTYSITAAAPIIFNNIGTNNPTRNPSFSPTDFLGNVSKDATKIYVGLIAGVVIGGAALILMITYCIYYYMTRKINKYKYVLPELNCVYIN